MPKTTPTGKPGTRPTSELERFRQLVEGSLDWAWEVDDKLVYTYVSPSVRDVLGFEAEELLGKTPLELMPPGEAERVAGVMAKFRSARSSFSLLQNVNLHKDGREIVLETSGVPILGDDGELRGYRGIDRDITERRRYEDELQRERNEARNYLDIVEVMIVALDADGRVTLVNRKGCEVLGRPEEEIVGRHWFRTFLPDAIRDDVENSFHELISEKRTPAEYYENLIRCRSGEQRVIAWHNAVMRDAAGNVTGTLSSGEDVTVRKRNQQALRRYERIVSATSDLMAFVDRDYTLLAVNHAFAEAIGRPVDEIVGNTVQTVQGAALFQDKLKDPLDRSLAGEEVGFRTWIDLPAAGRRYLDSRYTPYREGGGPVSGVVVSSRDITDLRQAEEQRENLEAQILHAQKLESLGVLAGGIAHDFNNLLTGILGNAGLALHELPSDADARARLEEIEKASLRAAELCKQMLAYSGRGRFKVQALDLSRVAEDVADLLAISIPRSAALVRSFGDPLPSVDADPVQVRQIVMNLVTNASDAIGDGPGTIEMATGVRDCDREYLSATFVDDRLPAGRYVYLEVTDTGCGMDRDTRARLFDPFFTTKFTGRGLGMAAVLGIVRGHGGAIEVDSEPGAGTTVRVLFPESGRVTGQVVEEPTSGEEWSGTGRVLVVDDEEAVRSLAQHVLVSAGFDVEIAQDGPEALRLFGKRNADLVAVLLDATMPGMGGEETFAALRRIRDDIPVILSSGYDEHEVSGRFRGSRPAAFIQKPYRPRDLLGTLRTVLER